MRYVDIINQEGAFNLVSENEIVKANIVDIHPELTFEDNSMLIFSSIDAYYDLIGDAEVFIQIDNDVNIEKLLDENLVNSDTVVDFSYNGDDVTMVYEISYHGYALYYLQRSGVNPISL